MVLKLEDAANRYPRIPEDHQKQQKEYSLVAEPSRHKISQV